RLLPRGPAEVTVRSGPAAGLRLVVRLEDEKYYWTGTYELEVQEAIVRVLEPGGVFWDVGGHAGFFAALAARQVGPTGSVHCFEPLPENRARLERAIELNRLENVAVHPLALSDRDGDALLHENPSSSMWSLVAAEAGAGGVVVPCRRLDSLAELAP